MLRNAIAIIGTIVLSVGFAQLIRPGTWPMVARSLVVSEYVTTCGLVAIAVGLILLVAGVRHIIRLPLFVIIIGGCVIIVGTIMFVYPEVARDFIWKWYLGMGPSIQTAITIGGAAVRMAVGGLLMYAGLAPPPRPKESAAPINTSEAVKKTDRSNQEES